MPGPVIVGLSLDDRDAPPLALGRLLGRLTGCSLALVHAYPYEPLTVPLPEYEAWLRDDSLEALRRVAAEVEPELDVTVHAHARLSAAYGERRPYRASDVRIGVSRRPSRPTPPLDRSPRSCSPVIASASPPIAWTHPQRSLHVCTEAGCGSVPMSL